MPQSLQFILLTLVLALGVIAGIAVGRLPFISPWWWLLPVLLLSFALSRFLKRFSSYYLFLALPLAACLAYAGSSLLWPHPVHTAQPLPKGGSGLVETGVAGMNGRKLFAPPGSSIGLFAEGLDAPRMLAFSPEGVLFVSLPESGRVVALPDRDADGHADRMQVFAEGLDRPHGLAFRGRDLLVVETGRLLLLVDQDQDLRADRKQVLSDDLPAGGGHWTRSLAVDQQGNLYVSIGSDCNACLEEDPRRATVMKIPADGGRATIFAYGLRNSVGLAFDPETNRLWASDNGRDRLGDDLPPDEINLLVEGADYGWPYCYGQKQPDPQLGNDLRCRQTRAAAIDLQAHSAPLGITFADRLDADESLRSSLLVAYHGSWNRSVPTGYKLVAIPFRNGRPGGPPRDLVTGWLVGSRAWGRPVAPLVGPDGTLYLSDDRAGVIYRIRFSRRSP